MQYISVLLVCMRQMNALFADDFIARWIFGVSSMLVLTRDLNKYTVQAAVDSCRESWKADTLYKLHAFFVGSWQLRYGPHQSAVGC